ncbi:serine/threonine-protein kinase [Polyangium mundeleinium]|uniref:Serine/threonine-protein kinase n=1 Tax=Polyangium mundeleinium TaxID=2995306 RepID=A0ABT5EU88_9BACT|nr:serine/threonine-protein kinase [Polyangium mundeleinium]MDC0744753.1 serine/threonine-protein kinase [Polyangium mundeleinium]
MACPGENTLNALLGGQLAPEMATRTEHHVGECPACQELLAVVGQPLGTSGGYDATPELGTRHEDTAPTAREARTPSADAPLQPGSAVRRYVVLSKVGAGGMGVVYAAYDPELNRRVALKVLRAEDQGEGSEQARARLLSEAQTLARLAHPNVVAIHDVGVTHGNVFLVMEFVEGPTLAAWLAERRRPVPEVLPIFLQAGRGLAAAHAVGIVHRDFKPANVVVGRDDRVRVLDFGLAREGQPQLPPRGAASLGAGAAGETSLSVVAGTPAYMAPEQHLGRRADARADQFSFCVALHEALHGVRPFRGDTAREILDSIQRGDVVSPRAGELPAWLNEALRRGLSAKPEARHPSLVELLAILERDRRALRRRIGMVVVPLLAAAVAGVAVRASMGPAAEPLCQGASRRLEGVWDTSGREAVRASFLATGLPYAAGAFDQVAADLDRRATEWASAHTQACEATRVRGEQTEEQLGRRMVCLERRLTDLGALTQALAQADVAVVDGSARAVSELAPVSDCENLASLSSMDPRPEDPAAQEEINRISGDLSRARAELAVGRYEDGLARMDPLIERAAGTRHGPLSAEALYLRARLRDLLGRDREAEVDYHAAAHAAISSHHDEIVASAWVDLFGILSFDTRRAEEAARSLDYARATIRRRGANPELTARLSVRICTRGNALADAPQIEADCRRAIDEVERFAPHDPELLAASLQALGSALRNQGKLADARAAVDRAITTLSKTLGKDHPSALRARRALALVHQESGALAEAEAESRSILESSERNLPADHPMRRSALFDLARVLTTRGDHAGALPLFQQAYEAQRRARGEDSEQAATCLEAMGRAQHSLGRKKEAIDHYQRSLAIREKTLGADHVSVAGTLVLLAVVRDDEGAHEEAISLVRRALDIREKALGPEHPLVAKTLDTLGRFYTTLGRLDAAEPLLERSLVINEARLGKEHPSLADALVPLADIHLERHAPKRAIPLLERAIALYVRHPGDPAILAEARYSLAQALVAVGEDRRRAITLADEARAGYVAAGPRAESAVAEVDAWLRQNRR